MTHPAVSLDFMPAFYHRHLGVTYGKAFYYDPEYRGSVECQQALFLHAHWGRHGVGAAHPHPSPGLFIQPLEIIMRTQGAEWRFPEDATLESWGTPWRGLDPAAIAAIDAQAAARHPVVDELLAQYRVLQKLYGESADLFGIKSGMMNIHAPLTTAQQLYGEELFMLLAEDPAAGGPIFTKVWELYQAIFQRLADALGARLTRVQLGDCAAAMLSPATYEAAVLPWNNRIARQFPRAGYHSCGSSTHLLPAFAKLEHMDLYQLGPGTDLAQAARQLPGTHLQPLIDPVLLRQGDTAQVRQSIAAVIRDCAPAPAVTLCLWSLDRDTPLANVSAVYETTPAPTPAD
jgi:hypothetical protein